MIYTVIDRTSNVLPNCQTVHYVYEYFITLSFYYLCPWETLCYLPICSTTDVRALLPARMFVHHEAKLMILVCTNSNIQEWTEMGCGVK